MKFCFFHDGFILCFSLGAPHDSGVENGPCDPEAYYLMAPYVAYVYENTRNTQPWQFSRCSVQSFRDYFDELRLVFAVKKY